MPSLFLTSSIILSPNSVNPSLLCQLPYTPTHRMGCDATIVAGALTRWVAEAVGLATHDLDAKWLAVQPQLQPAGRAIQDLASGRVNKQTANDAHLAEDAVCLLLEEVAVWWWRW